MSWNKKDSSLIHVTHVLQTAKGIDRNMHSYIPCDGQFRIEPQRPKGQWPIWNMITD